MSSFQDKLSSVCSVHQSSEKSVDDEMKKEKAIIVRRELKKRKNESLMALVAACNAKKAKKT